MQRTRIYEHPEADGSRTMVIHDSAPREARSADAGGTNISGDNNADLRNEDDAQRLVLSLHGGGQVKRKKHGQRVVWKDDVVDNEGAGKKKSKSTSLPSGVPGALPTLSLCSMLHLPQAS